MTNAKRKVVIKGKNLSLESTRIERETRVGQLMNKHILETAFSI